MNEKEDLFIPEKNISIDAEHTLEQLSGRFQSIKDGLPEIIKNSKDHYSRLKVQKKEDRQIIIIVSDDEKNLGVLDFAGAALEDFQGWKTWSSRTANRKEMADDIEAGYGNGGKSFMVRGCSEMASMCGYRDRKINKWGFVNNKKGLRYRAGIFKNKEGKELKEFEYDNPESVLNSEIISYGVNLISLPKEAQEAFKKRDAFTFVSLRGIKDWEKLHGMAKKRALKFIATDLMQHAQASLTLETCSVWVMMGSRLLFKDKLGVSDLLPFEGLEEIESIKIPQTLKDPDTGEEIKLKFTDPEKNILTIKTSRHNLRLSDRHKARNVIRIKNKRNIVANWLMADLVSLTSSAFIYGTLQCELLDGDNLAGPERMSLPDTPLTRSLKDWTSEKCNEVAKKIQKMQASRNAQEDKTAASETLQKLRELMKEFLNRDSNTGEYGNEEKGGRTTTSGTKKKKGKRIDEIVLEVPGKTIRMGVGTTIPIIVKCFEHRDGKRIPVNDANPIPCVDNLIVEWVGSNMIKSLKSGKTKIVFENQKGNIRSNPIDVEVVSISEVKIENIEEILKQGEKKRLKITCKDENQEKIESMIYECSVDEMEMGSINREGVFTAGGISGTATIRIKYGKKDSEFKISKANIGDEKVNRDKGNRGEDIPLIILCGEEAPGKEDLAKENRTHVGGEDYPTIIDNDPLWDGIVWINPDSKESRKVRSRGEGGIMKISCQSFRQFLALKCFEVLKRLKVEDEFKGESYTFVEFKNSISQAEMDTAGFLDKSYSLVKELVKGGDDEE